MSRLGSGPQTTEREGTASNSIEGAVGVVGSHLGNGNPTGGSKEFPGALENLPGAESREASPGELDSLTIGLGGRQLISGVPATRTPEEGRLRVAVSETESVSRTGGGTGGSSWGLLTDSTDSSHSADGGTPVAQGPARAISQKGADSSGLPAEMPTRICVELVHDSSGSQIATEPISDAVVSNSPGGLDVRTSSIPSLAASEGTANPPAQHWRDSDALPAVDIPPRGGRSAGELSAPARESEEAVMAEQAATIEPAGAGEQACTRESVAPAPEKRARTLNRENSMSAAVTLSHRAGDIPADPAGPRFSGYRSDGASTDRFVDAGTTVTGNRFSPAAGGEGAGEFADGEQGNARLHSIPVKGGKSDTVEGAPLDLIKGSPSGSLSSTNDARRPAGSPAPGPEDGVETEAVQRLQSSRPSPRAARSLLVEVPADRDGENLLLRFQKRSDRIDVRISSGSDRAIRDLQTALPSLIERLEAPGRSAGRSAEGPPSDRDDPGQNGDAPGGSPKDSQTGNGENGGQPRSQSSRGAPQRPSRSARPGYGPSFSSWLPAAPG